MEKKSKVIMSVFITSKRRRFDAKSYIHNALSE